MASRKDVLRQLELAPWRGVPRLSRRIPVFPFFRGIWRLLSPFGRIKKESPAWHPGEIWPIRPKSPDEPVVPIGCRDAAAAPGIARRPKPCAFAKLHPVSRFLSVVQSKCMHKRRRVAALPEEFGLAVNGVKQTAPQVCAF